LINGREIFFNVRFLDVMVTDLSQEQTYKQTFNEFNEASATKARSEPEINEEKAFLIPIPLRLINYFLSPTVF
jgi:hypothetical protein